MTDRPNVLLIVLDSVRASNTSLHGYENETTPFLSSLGETETLYTETRAPGTESLSSHTSMFTGYSVREHGITDRRSRLAPGHTIWEELADRGYTTGVFSNNPFLTELPVGLRDCFQTVVGRRVEHPFPNAVNPKEFVIDTPDAGVAKYFSFLQAMVENGNFAGSIANGLSFKLHDSYLPEWLQPNGSARQYADRLLQWADRQERPWAACLNLMDAHYPYEPAPSHDNWGGDEIRAIQSAVEDQAWEFVAGDRPWGQRQALESLYDGAIHQADAALRHVAETMEQRGVREKTLTIVTSDHGEGFGERSFVRPDARVVGHGNGGVHESIFHVPLVVDYPHSVGGGEYDDLVSLTVLPELIRTTVSGNPDPTTPLSDDGRVVCSTDGVDPDTRDRVIERCGDAHPYDLPADAVYESTGETIRKHVSWGDRDGTVTLGRPPSFTLSDQTPATTLDTEDAGISRRPNDDVDTAVKDRLEDLGYA